MKKVKWLLYTGILLLIIGISLQVYLTAKVLPIVIIALGALSKILFILITIANKIYKPGVEVIFLVFGLTLFFIGVYLKENPQTLSSIILISLGIVLKTTFVILFIISIKKSSNTLQR